MMYFDCKDCVFASNSSKQAQEHQDGHPDHKLSEEKD